MFSMTQKATVTVPGGWALIDMYTTPCCRALFHLDPVAKFVWKSSWFYWILREPSVAFSFILSAVSFLGKNSTLDICFFPHSMLGRKCWASSCLNRSTQVSWVEIWKPPGQEGYVFSFENFYD